jgi:hypothetical protein
MPEEEPVDKHRASALEPGHNHAQAAFEGRPTRSCAGHSGNRSQVEESTGSPVDNVDKTADSRIFIGSQAITIVDFNLQQNLSPVCTALTHLSFILRGLNEGRNWRGLLTGP